MLHLLKAEWAYKRTAYIFAIAFSNLTFFYLYPGLAKHPASSPEHCIAAMGLMIASMIVGVIIMGMAQPFYNGKVAPDLSVRFYSLLPLSSYEYQSVRLLTGSPLLVGILTLEITGYLYAIRAHTGDCYLIIFIFGLIFFDSQILCYILADFSTSKTSRAWLAKPGTQFVVVFFLVPILILVGAFLLKQHALYHYTGEIALISILFSCALVAANFHLFCRRKSFLE